MQLASHILRLTGKSYQEVFAANPPLVVLADEGDGPKIKVWNTEALNGVAQPTSDQVAAILAAPEYVDLTDYAANRRWEKEVGGIDVSGVQVATDDRSKQMIMGARIAAQANNAFTTQWVGADGNVTQLNATQIITVSDAVAAHVAACFATYATVRASIIAGTITTTTQIDQAFAA